MIMSTQTMKQEEGEEEEVDVPKYFICPISLQIMKDPVTAVTGITYDRESIEHWFKTAKESSCPVSNQPLPRDSELTPNHMLRRLIQAWCTANAKHGFDLIPIPKSPLTKSHLHKLIRDLSVPHLFINALKKLDSLANENQKNRKSMAELGLISKTMVLCILKCFKEDRITGLEEALRILHLTWNPNIDENVKEILKGNYLDFIRCILWVLKINDDHVLKTHAILALKATIEAVSSTRILERLDREFFKEIVNILRNRNKFSQQGGGAAIKASLHVLVEASSQSANSRMKIIETGVIFDLVEIELSNPDKKTTELIFCLLTHLCSCADGRAELLRHAGALAMIAKRLLRVSSATDDRAVDVLGLIGKFSGTRDVVLEMLRIGAVSKLCMVLQADCEGHLKKKAREVLRLHSNVWSNSPCIQVYLLTRHTR